MRILLLLALLAVPLWGAQSEYRLAAGTTNLTTSFGSTPQLTGFTQITSVQVYNNTNQEVEVNCTSGTVQPAPCTTGLCVGSFHVPVGATVSSQDQASLSRACFIRANSSTANSGTLYVIGWGW